MLVALRRQVDDLRVRFVRARVGLVLIQPLPQRERRL